MSEEKWIPHQHHCEIKLLQKYRLKELCPVRGKLSKDEHECDYCKHMIIIDFYDDGVRVKNIERNDVESR